MKKWILSIAVLPAIMFASCGEKAKEEKKEGDEEKKEEVAEETSEETPAAEEITCAQPMMDFMAMLKGSYKDVEAALEKYEKEGLDRVDMDMYDLKEAKVVACSKSETGECCTMEAGAGMTIRTYDICWEGDKIASIVDKGMR